MSDYNDDDYDDNPAGLRAALKKAQKEAREATARAEQAEADRAAALKSVKSQSLASLLADAKAPAGLAKWLEKDDVEASKEAVESWLKENGELFNLKPQKEAPVDEVVDEEPEDEVDPELAEALDQSSQLDALGASKPLREINKAISDIPDNLSFEEGVAQMRALGIVG